MQQMHTIPLANTTRQTTRLGFGCGSLMGATNRRDSLQLLETAYEAGIRHFDVAPMYGTAKPKPASANSSSITEAKSPSPQSSA